MKIIEYNIDYLICIFDIFVSLKIGFLTRFIPITDLRLFPSNLNKIQRREWAILDTFDAFSPVYDNPQKIKTVVKFFEKDGCIVNFAGEIKFNNIRSCVLRATKIN